MNLHRISIAILLLTVLIAACSSTQKAGNGATAGQVVTVTGTAQNAKLGAVVITDEGSTYYIDGKSDWSADGLTGKRVTVTGTLKIVTHDPTTLKNERGEYSSGMSGDQLVLVDARW